MIINKMMCCESGRAKYSIWSGLSVVCTHAQLQTQAGVQCPAASREPAGKKTGPSPCIVCRVRDGAAQAADTPDTGRMGGQCSRGPECRHRTPHRHQSQPILRGERWPRCPESAAATSAPGTRARSDTVTPAPHPDPRCQPGIQQCLSSSDLFQAFFVPLFYRFSIER